MAVPNPFKGLKPFGPADALFGRDSDLTLMKDRIFRNKTTLFFAGSGVGKTSFFQAKLIPEMERRYRDQFKVFYHREWAGREPLVALKETLQLPASKSLQSLFGALPISDGSSPSSSSFILILDQFEELFQYQIYWPHFIAFRDELCSAINRSETSGRFIFSMREDFLGQLSVFDNWIPDLFANYYRLKNPDLTQAEEIIRRTAELSKIGVDDDGIQKLIDDLSRIEGASPRNRLRESFRRDYVFPPHLQLVCKRLWQIESGRSYGSSFSFLADYENQKRTRKTSPAQRLLKEICIERMSALKPEQQDLAAKAFDYLVTSQGAKVAYELRSLAKHMKEDRKQLAATLERLTRDPRILRESTRQRERWFELYHDMYAPIMYEWKESFDNRRGKEREREQRGLIFDRKAIQEEARDNMDAALLFWLSALEIQDTDDRRRQVGRIEKCTFALRKTFRHEGQITAMCFGTDGTEVVTASTVTLPVTSDDGVTENKEHTLLQVWNRDSGIPIGKTVEFPGKTTLVALHSGERLVAAFGGNKLHIIHFETRVVQSRRLSIDTKTTRVRQLSWYPNGKFLILELWRLSLRTWLSVPIKKSAKVKSTRLYQRVVFDSTSRTAISQKGRQIGLFDAATMSAVRPPVSTRGIASALAVSTDGRLFAAGFKDGKVNIWGTRSSKQVSSPINTKGLIRRIVFLSSEELVTLSVRKSRDNQSLEIQRWSLLDGKQLGSPSVVSSHSAFLSRRARYAYADRRLGGPAAWRISTGKLIDARWIGRTNAPSIAWSDDDEYVLVNNKPNSVRLLSAADIPEVDPLFPNDATAASSAILSPDGAHVACATSESVIVFGSRRRVTLKIPSDVPVSHLAYGFGGRFLAILDEEGGLQVWDVQSGKQVASLAMHDDDSYEMLVNPKGRSLVVLASKLRWWNFGSGERKTKIVAKSENGYWSAQFSESGKILAIANISGQVEVWDTTRPNKIANIPNEDGFGDFALSPDGKLILTSTENGEATVWRAHGAFLYKLNHEAPVDASAFSRSSRFAVTSSQDNFIRLWDMGQGDEIGRFRVEGLIRDLRFTPDERGIIAASNWNVTRFDIDPSLVPRATRQLMGRWMGQSQFLGPDGRRLMTLLGTGVGSYRTEIVNFDAVDAKAIDGPINPRVAMWQNRMGLLRDGEELISASLVRASRPSAQPAKRNSNRISALRV